MTHKFKSLGLALVAVFAMSVVVASAAQAASFHAELGTVNPGSNITTGEVVTGGEATVSGAHVFTATPGGLQVTCKMAAVKGTNNGTSNGTTLTSETQTVTPEYSDCSSVVGAATVDAKCHYTFNANTNGAGQGASAIACEGTNRIVIKIGECEIKFGTQTPGGGVTYVNKGTGTTRDVVAEANVTGVSFVTNGAFLCTLGGIPSSGSAGTYKGNMTVKSFEDKNTAGNAGKTGIYEEGKQLGAFHE